MNDLLLRILILLGVGIPVAIIVLRILFKDSILFKIVSFWATSILLSSVNTNLSISLPEAYPQYLSLPVGIFIVVSLVYQVYRLIRKPLDESLRNLVELSKGNLDLKTNKELLGRKDELGTLSRNINLLAQTLKQVISGVKNSSEFIAAASNELSGTAQQLSQGSNEQASASEQVSASMEQMVSNIKQNAENAKQTEDIAKNASVGMNKVSLASNNSLVSIKEIANKTGIISDIAFQTNILALNAAVEAARAGAYGKGFAVVAAEVRKLAERSKVAADEINSLTSSSVKITEKANQYMDETIPEINKTSKLVKEITVSSTEQDSGAAQINNALFELNNVTQQNAASSEEMASSSEELSAQAEQLKELITFFKFTDIKQQNFSKAQRGIPKKEKVVAASRLENQEQKKPFIIDMSNDSDSGFERY